MSDEAAELLAELGYPYLAALIYRPDADDQPPCPGCGRGAGLWCAPWCEYADPGEPCPDCSAAKCKGMSREARLSRVSSLLGGRVIDSVNDLSYAEGKTVRVRL